MKHLTFIERFWGGFKNHCYHLDPHGTREQREALRFEIWRPRVIETMGIGNQIRNPERTWKAQLELNNLSTGA